MIPAASTLLNGQSGQIIKLGAFDLDVYDRVLLSNRSSMILDVYSGQNMVRLYANTQDILPLTGQLITTSVISVPARTTNNDTLQAVLVGKYEQLTENYPVSLSFPASVGVVLTTVDNPPGSSALTVPDTTQFPGGSLIVGFLSGGGTPYNNGQVLLVTGVVASQGNNLVQLATPLVVDMPSGTLLVRLSPAYIAGPGQSVQQALGQLSRAIGTYAFTSVNSGNAQGIAYRGIAIYIITFAGAGGTVTVTLFDVDDTLSAVPRSIIASAAIGPNAAAMLKVYPGIAAVANALANDVLAAAWQISAVVAGAPIQFGIRFALLP